MTLLRLTGLVPDRTGVLKARAATARAVCSAHGTGTIGPLARPWFLPGPRLLPTRAGSCSQLSLELRADVGGSC